MIDNRLPPSISASGLWPLIDSDGSYGIATDGLSGRDEVVAVTSTHILHFSPYTARLGTISRQLSIFHRLSNSEFSSYPPAFEWYMVPGAGFAMTYDKPVGALRFSQVLYTNSLSLLACLAFTMRLSPITIVLGLAAAGLAAPLNMVCDLYFADRQIHLTVG